MRLKGFINPKDHGGPGFALMVDGTFVQNVHRLEPAIHHGFRDLVENFHLFQLLPQNSKAPIGE